MGVLIWWRAVTRGPPATKCEHQLRQREEMGEVLSAVDFDQLKIENQQVGHGSMIIPLLIY